MKPHDRPQPSTAVVQMVTTTSIWWLSVMPSHTVAIEGCGPDPVFTWTWTQHQQQHPTLGSQLRRTPKIASTKDEALPAATILHRDSRGIGHSSSLIVDEHHLQIFLQDKRYEHAYAKYKRNHSISSSFQMATLMEQ